MARIAARSFLRIASFGLLGSIASAVSALPPNFEESVAWSGFFLPTAVRFAPNGQVFVAEKSGLIKVFDGIDDSTPTVFADLRSEVFDVGDRGLLGLAIDPNYPTRPYVYVFYALDAPPGQTPPVYNDRCQSEANCPANSRLTQLTATGNVATSRRTVLEGWCHDSWTHSAADLVFAADGSLLVSHGDGATPLYADYGQFNSCGDPSMEGGALHAQDVRTQADPFTYAGSVIRINAETGVAAPGNPLSGGTPGDDPIVANGFRNPFRMSIDKTTGRVWVGDVGWDQWEEINTFASPTDAVEENFGWPCYEGNARQAGYDAANIPICEALYQTPDALPPYYQYTAPGDQAISGVALYRGNTFPQEYDGALFFADYTQGWLRVMKAGTNGLPNPAAVTDFIASGVAPVDLQVGPGGDLYYVDIGNGSIRKIRYLLANASPVARIVPSATYGALPLTITFNGSTSSDPDPGDTLTYAWDLDGDGAFDDSTAPSPTFTYTTAGQVTVQLRVTDPQAKFSIAAVTVDPGNGPPVATIVTPAAGATFATGEAISFSGGATNINGQPLPASALRWQVILHHCAVANPTDCHEHFIHDLSGVASGTFTGPDHEFPAYAELRLTATSGSLTNTKSINIQPRTALWTFTSAPSAMEIAVYGAVQRTPFTREVIVGSQTTISAISPQLSGGSQHTFSSWSDSGAQTHLVVATTAPQTFHAVFTPAPAACSLTATPSSIVVGGSSTLAWTATNATSVTIDQGIGAVTPVAGGSRSVSPTATTTYTATVVGAAGTRTCAATVTVTAAPAETLWRSYDIAIQASSAQGALSSAVGTSPTVVDFYESTNDGGVGKGALLPTYSAGAHPDTFNRAQQLWSSGAGSWLYPYVGKSTVNRGSDFGETNTPTPTGVRDLQMHPPNSARLTVAAFRVPLNSDYSVVDLAVRRVDDNPGQTSRLRVFNGAGTQIANLQASGLGWVRGAASYTVGTQSTGSYIYFAVDGDGSFAWDATEVAFTVRATSTGPVTPSCTLTPTPSSVTAGNSASLAWTTANATGLTIDQGLGAATPVAGGSRTITPSATTTYTGTVTGPNGPATCTATVTVTAAPPPQPVCSLSMTPSSVPAGSAATLSWTTTNTTSLTINQGVGAATPVGAGTASVAPAATTTYTGSATGPGGTASCTTTLVVTGPPTCTFTATPSSIVTGSTSSLAWTTTNASTVTIDQGVGAATPVAGGSRSVSPTATTTYTANVAGPAGSTSCAATVTVGAAPAETLWRSYDIAVQASTAQGTLSSAVGTSPTVVDFYESTNDGGIGKGSLLPTYFAGVHGDTFNRAQQLWSSGSGSWLYPYVGKSTVNRGSDLGESNTPTPTGVRDLQMHPPNSARLTVAAFRVPQNGDYSVVDLAVRRVDENAGQTSRLRVFNAAGTQIANLQASGQGWVRGAASYTVGTQSTGSYIYFAVDADGSFSWDATEVAFTVRATSSTPPPLTPSCSLIPTPSSVTAGGSSSLAWTTANATALTINQGIGAATPVGSGSVTVTPSATTTYTGTVTGPNGTATCAGTVTVTPVPPPQPVCSLSMTPSSVPAGNAATLSWTTSNVTSLTISPVVGAATPVAAGTASVSPAATTTYTGSATGPGGTTTCTTTLIVTGPPTCTLTATPSSIVTGGTSSLAWTTTNANTVTIDQGLGAVTPVAGGSRSVSPTATTTYTANVAGSSGSTSCAATVTVSAAPAETLWRSYDIAIQASSAQGALSSSTGTSPTVVDFYESTNDGGIGKGSLLPTYSAGVHGDTFNRVQQIWSSGAGSWLYPYVGKSTVNRGSDFGETNTPTPAGVRDLQMHPPNSARLTVAAFRVPQNGNYSVVDLAVRRVDDNPGQTARLRVFNGAGTQIANLQTSGLGWVLGSATYTLGALSAGSYIYFAVDADGSFAWDATEVAFTVRATAP